MSIYHSFYNWRSNSRGNLIRVGLLWIFLLTAAILLSTSFPNSIFPGLWRNHPPFYLAWLALLPLWWLILRPQSTNTSTQYFFFMLVFFANVLGWIKLFGILPWLGLAIILSLLTLLAYKLLACWQIKPSYRVIFFALAWCAIEWLRGLGTFGLSWAQLGASQIDSPFANIISLGGLTFVSFLMLLLTGYTVEWLRQEKKVLPIKPLLAAGLILACLLAGNWQVNKSTALWQTAKQQQQFALIQPSSQRNLTPEELITVPTQSEIDARNNTLLQLSRGSLAKFTPIDPQHPPLIIWPESSISGEPVNTFPQIFEFARNNGSYLLCGAVYYEPQQDYRPTNTAYLIAPNGIEAARYAKVHLVPFGEFVPLRSLVERLYIVRDTDIAPGEGWNTVKVNSQRLGIGICFESSYDYIARAYVNKQANYLLYITNDSWFKDSPAIQQHFNHSRFRALESGLPVVRVASSGISGVIAPDGDVISEIALNKSGFSTETLNAGTAGTIFSKFGWLFSPTCCAVLLIWLLGIIFRRKNSQTN